MNMKKQLVVLYGRGGLSDVGRHAVQVALQETKTKSYSCSVTVLTPHPELLEEPNWNCGCPEPHVISDDHKKNMKMVAVQDWDDEKLVDHFQGCDAVISCLGNRQPTFMDVPQTSWCAHQGNEMVIRAMKTHNIERAVVMSSMGIEEDWPPAEFHWAGKIMSALFVLPGCARRPYQDLTLMERAYRKSSAGLDYLLVRPVGLGEDVLPEDQWKIQTKKYEDADIDMNVAKLDVARFMVQEALEPTRHRDAVVIGGVPKPAKDGK